MPGNVPLIAGLLLLIAFAHPGAAQEANFSGTWRVMRSADTGPIAALPACDTDLSIEDVTKTEAAVAARLPGGSDIATRDHIAEVVGHPVGPHSLLRLVTVSGYGGCNDFTRFYLAEPEGKALALHWYEMLSTAMACHPDSARESAERPIASESFQFQPRLRLQNGLMLVADDRGKEIARFERVKR